MTPIRQAFRQQAEACAALGSPLMERLMTGLAERLEPGDPVADTVLGWQGDSSARADSVPLRLAGGLHALILTDQALLKILPLSLGDLYLPRQQNHRCLLF